MVTFKPFTLEIIIFRMEGRYILYNTPEICMLKKDPDTAGGISFLLGVVSEEYMNASPCCPNFRKVEKSDFSANYKVKVICIRMRELGSRLQRKLECDMASSHKSVRGLDA